MFSRDSLRTTLLGLLEEEMGQSYPMLTDDQDLRDSLGLDSVDLVGVVMRVEGKFRIRLSTEEMAAVRNLSDVLDLIEAKLAALPEVSANGSRELEAQAG